MAKTNADDWLNKNPEVDAIFVAVCDINGVFRGKRVPSSQIEKVLSGGVRMPLSAATLDIWGRDIEGSALVFETGDADGVAELTERGLIPISWLEKPTAFAQVWLSHEDAKPFEADPRHALSAIVKKYKARGLKPVIATELEFYLTNPNKDRAERPINPTTGARLSTDDVLSMTELEEFDGFLNDVYAACKEQSIPADAAISENGAGQFEINLLHTDDPLRAADDALLFKRLVRGVARKHGLTATFMAKPYGTSAGNGLHVHFSLLDQQGKNVFDDGTELGSEMLKHAVGGLLKTMQENTLVFAPHMNSYRRIAPDSHAPTAVAWGYENRTTSIRIPGGPGAARRVEHRVAGADANPYLVLAAVLGGALIGIEKKLQPDAPVKGDAYSQNLVSLPMNWMNATEAFANGPYAKEVFGDTLHDIFVQAKRQELRKFSETVSTFEYQSYLEIV